MSLGLTSREMNVRIQRNMILLVCSHAWTRVAASLSSLLGDSFAAISLLIRHLLPILRHLRERAIIHSILRVVLGKGVVVAQSLVR